MKTYLFSSVLAASIALGVTSCSQDDITGEEIIPDGKMSMNFTFSLPGESRATETAFEQGDKVGLFVNESDKQLEIGGNTVNNAMLTCNGSNWNPEYNLYWDNGTYNVQAYYPYTSYVSSIEDFPFEVKTDQSTSKTSNELGGFEASDFLFASATGVAASTDAVNLKFSHIMSRVTVSLVKGDDYVGDLPSSATVKILNTVPSATIDLEAGVATKDAHGTSTTITAAQTGTTTYSAIIVPQRLDNRVPLIEIIMDGVSFLYESKFVFKPGVHHQVNLVIDKNAEQVKIEIGGEISGWN